MHIKKEFFTPIFLLYGAGGWVKTLQACPQLISFFVLTPSLNNIVKKEMKKIQLYTLCAIFLMTFRSFKPLAQIPISPPTSRQNSI